jgi:cell division protein FtsA
MDEILDMACKEITKSGCEDILAAGVVLTGGASILEGVPELAEQIFNMPVRRGCPQGIGGLTNVVNSPLYATGVGLVLYGSRENAVGKGLGEGNFVSRSFKRLKLWVLDFF